MSEFRDDDTVPEVRSQDPYLPVARERLRALFTEHRDEVFFSRQLEVRYEAEFFHWITNRALRELAQVGVLKSERRELLSHAIVHLYWHRRNRYAARAADRVIRLVSEVALCRHLGLRPVMVCRMLPWATGPMQTWQGGCENN